jgi:hypothetical protein
MKNISRILTLIVLTAFVSVHVFARELVTDTVNYKKARLKQTTAGCAPAASYEWLDINNVRARINTGGDMWWDLPGGTGSKYFIPKNGSATSMFSGSLWIGGLDINNQLKLAALRYRGIGVDYWTGPLTIDGTAAIDNDVCAKYDKLFKMNRAMVDEFLSHTDPETGVFVPDENYTIPKEIMDWPAHGDPSRGQSYYLAPFYDNDGDGEYNPLMGDYPYYDIANELCHTKTPTMDEEIEGSIYGSILADQVIKGDQTLWWVFNDKGNIHSETKGSAIGMEIRAQAFAFATNDVINNMTFYSYEIINRSTFELTQTYFSPWVDTDLGYAWDDYVGCDVARGLGYCYNGKQVDGNGEPESYGDQPPAIGVDFFQGPYMDPDGIDNPKYEKVYDPNTGEVIYKQLCDESINGVNFGNGIVDDERFGMRRFVYHNNSTGPQGDPRIAPEYYNYLRGFWRDGTPMMYGGTAYVGGPGTVGPVCDFMFPGDSDPCNWGTGGIPPNGGYTQNGFYWTELTGNNGGPNPPGDRRFMQSAGPFTLKPGAVNYITVGIPWARATSGGPWASVELLRVVDDKCQALFDNCFKVIDGPSAPDLTFRELDKELIVYLSNSPSSNNYHESYSEYDPNILQPDPNDPTKRNDSIYRFEGYQIFQLRDKNVSVDELFDPDKARLVFQCDVKNGVKKIVNYTYNDAIGANVPQIMVEGGDNGIKHSFILKQDAFAKGDVSLVNNKVYYYMALAYAYNEYLPYTDDPGVLNGLFGQKKPYLAGRKNIKLYKAMPHKIVNGILAHGNYGDQPQTTRLAGTGNGGQNLALSKETVEEILSKPPASETNVYGSPDYPISYNPVYKVNGGPVNVSVIDPLNVVEADFELLFDSLYYVKMDNVTGRPEIHGDTASKLVSRWVLINKTTGEKYYSDTTIQIDNDQLFLDLGLAVEIYQPYNPGPYKVGVNGSQRSMYAILAKDNGFINSSVVYSDTSHQWLSGIPDMDIPGSPLNWIRAGVYKAGAGGNPADDDWNMSTDPDRPWDPNEFYEKIIGGTWAPYALCSYGNSLNLPGSGGTQSELGPALSLTSKGTNMNDISSVDIVLTPDKSKWTRCPVIEMCYDPLLAQGNANMFGLRSAPSVDKDGNPATIGSGPSDNPEDPNYIMDHGMGWFPGYVIDVESGERLNVMFGEDSYLDDMNGRDMLFNPTARDPKLSPFADPNIYRYPGGEPVFGGKHFVYIMKHDYTEAGQGAVFNSPAYDAGAYAAHVLDTIFNSVYKVFLNSFYKQVMYVGMPMGVKGEDWLANEVTLKIRVSKPYARYFNGWAPDSLYDGIDYNNFYPAYAFSTNGIATEYSNPEKQETDLDLINIVPNPYYAYSDYEHNALDNRVKLTNLPEKCDITIYNVSGVKVKQFTKDTPLTTIEWDLKNFAGVPISGGVYYIHIKAPEGERVIKWFAVLRIPDLNTF